jgi:hypothetical protein
MTDENLTQSLTPPRKSPATAYIQEMSEMAAVPEHTASKRKKTRPVRVEIGIYRHPNESTYHERPSINGKRTWRSLGMNFTPQHNLAAARDEFRRRRAMQAEGKDP